MVFRSGLETFLESANQTLTSLAINLHETINNAICNRLEDSEGDSQLPFFWAVVLNVICETNDILAGTQTAQSLADGLTPGIIYALEYQPATIVNGQFQGWGVPFNLVSTLRATAPIRDFEWEVDERPILRPQHWFFNGRGLPPQPSGSATHRYRARANGGEYDGLGVHNGVRLIRWVPVGGEPTGEPPDEPVSGDNLVGDRLSGTQLFGDIELDWEIEISNCPTPNFNGTLGGIPFNFRADGVTIGQHLPCPVLPTGGLMEGEDEGSADDLTEPLAETSEVAGDILDGEGMDNENGIIVEVRIEVTTPPVEGRSILLPNESDSTFFAGYFRWTNTQEGVMYSHPEQPIRKTRNTYARPDRANGFRFYSINGAVLQSTVIRQPLEMIEE